MLCCTRCVYGGRIFTWNSGARTFRTDGWATQGVNGYAGIPQARKKWDATRQDRERIRGGDARRKVALVLFWAGLAERQNSIDISYQLSLVRCVREGSARPAEKSEARSGAGKGICRRCAVTRRRGPECVVLSRRPESPSHHGDRKRADDGTVRLSCQTRSRGGLGCDREAGER